MRNVSAAVAAGGAESLLGCFRREDDEETPRVGEVPSSQDHHTLPKQPRSLIEVRTQFREALGLDSHSRPYRTTTPS